MAGANPYKARVCDFNYTRQDDIPIVFIIEGDDGNGNPNGTPVNITGRTYKMEGNAEPEPADETDHLFQLVGVVTDGPNGELTFSPTGGAGGDTDPTDAGGADITAVFYDVVETTTEDFTKIRGEITIDPRITDKGV
jgi:hypothetical protein